MPEEILQEIRDVSLAIGHLAEGNITDLRLAYVRVIALWARLNRLQYLPDDK